MLSIWCQHVMQKQMTIFFLETIQISWCPHISALPAVNIYRPPPKIFFYSLWLLYFSIRYGNQMIFHLFWKSSTSASCEFAWNIIITFIIFYYILFCDKNMYININLFNHNINKLQKSNKCDNWSHVTNCLYLCVNQSSCSKM